MADVPNGDYGLIAIVPAPAPSVPAPSVVGPMSGQNGTKYRLVKDAPGYVQPVAEKCLGCDAMGVEGWQRLTPQSDPADLWNALQAALGRL